MNGPEIQSPTPASDQTRIAAVTKDAGCSAENLLDGSGRKNGFGPAKQLVAVHAGDATLGICVQCAELALHLRQLLPTIEAESVQCCVTRTKLHDSKQQTGDKLPDSKGPVGVGTS